MTATAPDPTTESANKHGCRFDWCENDRTANRSQQLEHIGPSTYVPATGNSLSRPSDKDAYGETLMTIGVGMRYNEDIDPAPTVFIHFHGGRRDVDEDAHLLIDEAAVLHQRLGDMIHLATEGSEFSAGEVLRHYSIDAVAGR